MDIFGGGGGGGLGTIQPTTHFVPEQQISFPGPGEGVGKHGYTHCPSGPF